MSRREELIRIIHEYGHLCIEQKDLRHGHPIVRETDESYANQIEKLFEEGKIIGWCNYCPSINQAIYGTRVCETKERAEKEISPYHSKITKAIPIRLPKSESPEFPDSLQPNGVSTIYCQKHRVHFQINDGCPDCKAECAKCYCSECQDTRENEAGGYPHPITCDGKCDTPNCDGECGGGEFGPVTIGEPDRIPFVLSQSPLMKLFRQLEERTAHLESYANHDKVRADNLEDRMNALDKVVRDRKWVGGPL